MKVAVDMDGVLYEWDKTARYMLRTYRGCKGLEIESTSWNFIENTVSEEDWNWLWTDGVQQGLFRKGHCVKGGIYSLTELALDGHEIVIVTHRPKSAVRDTLAWLDLMFGAEEPYPLSGVHILSNGQPKWHVNCDILIDDKPENCFEWASRGRRAMLFTREWNTNVLTMPEPLVTRVWGWDQILRETDPCY